MNYSLELDPTDPIALTNALREAKRQNDIERYLELCTESIFSEGFGAALIHALKFAQPKEHVFLKADHPYDLSVGMEIDTHQKDGTIVTFVVTSTEDGGRVKYKSDMGDRDLAMRIGNLCFLYADRQDQPIPVVYPKTPNNEAGVTYSWWGPPEHHVWNIYLKCIQIVLGERSWFFWLWSKFHHIEDAIEYTGDSFGTAGGHRSESEYWITSDGKVSCKKENRECPKLPELNEAEIEEFRDWSKSRRRK